MGDKYEEYLINRARIMARIDRIDGLLRRAIATLNRCKSAESKAKWEAEVNRAQELLLVERQLLDKLADDLIDKVFGGEHEV